MAYPERRTQVFTDPRFDNRPFRRGKTKGFSPNQDRDPRRSGADAAAYLEDEMGVKADSQGNYGPTRDYGRDMMLGSQQRNSLSRGTPGGYASGLGNPLNSNLTPRGFADSIQQRNQVMSREQRIAQAQRDGTFDTIRDKYNRENPGSRMNRFGNISSFAPKQTQRTESGMPLDNSLIEKRGFGSPVQQTPSGMKLDNSLLEKRSFYTQRPGTPAATGENPMYSPKAGAPPASAINTGLQDRAAGLRFLREMSGPTLTNGQGGSISNTAPQIGDVRNISGKYGSGSSTFSPPGTERKEGTVNGVGFAEMMQGLANKQVREGTWREGDRLPEGMTAEQAKKANEEARQAILSRQRTAKTK